MVLKRQHPLHIAGEHVNFQIDTAAHAQMLQCSVDKGMRNQVDGKTGAADPIGGQADAIDGDRALARNVSGQGLGRPNFQQSIIANGIEAQHLANAINVT